MWQSILLTEAAARQLTSTSRASGFPPDRLQPEFVRPAGGKRVLAGSCRPAVNTQPTHRVRLAEWSKAPDLSSGSRERAWVRTPHLTKQPFGRISLLGFATILPDFSFEGGAGVQFWNPAVMHIGMHWGQTKQSQHTFNQIMPISRDF